MLWSLKYVKILTLSLTQARSVIYDVCMTNDSLNIFWMQQDIAGAADSVTGSSTATAGGTSLASTSSASPSTATVKKQVKVTNR